MLPGRVVHVEGKNSLSLEKPEESLARDCQLEDGASQGDIVHSGAQLCKPCWFLHTCNSSFLPKAQLLSRGADEVQKPLGNTPSLILSTFILLQNH